MCVGKISLNCKLISRISCVWISLKCKLISRIGCVSIFLSCKPISQIGCVWISLTCKCISRIGCVWISLSCKFISWISCVRISLSCKLISWISCVWTSLSYKLISRKSCVWISLTSCEKISLTSGGRVGAGVGRRSKERCCIDRRHSCRDETVQNSVYKHCLSVACFPVRGAVWKVQTREISWQEFGK